MSAEEKFFNDFSLLISQLIRKLNLLERDEKVCLGVTISQCYTIETLARKDKLSMKELSQEMGVAVSTMTRILDVLVRDGLAKRENNPKDRRSVYVQLTAKGKNLASKLKGCTEDYLRAIFERIPNKKQEEIIESLDILLKAIEQHPFCSQSIDRTGEYREG
ncbi:MarR family transcriptional regulator [Candidatus Aerophobetes bacterium]|uniref:MarR family transcriptional regulator n=1 Tax=Aerophobetes bacterium TaxID=2030807 RepID=A0A523RPR2_UNCAE|nr:MAG: MarR family transcriptional regulator [Candidatus Aerophobetes bacterium]